MKHEEMQLQSKDLLKLYAQKWEPGDKIKGVICLVHGLGEHSNRYTDWVEKLNNDGFAVLSFDLRGHGKSEGQRGHTPSYDHYADDIAILLDQAAKYFPVKPCFLYGHSMGALLVLYYLVQRQPGIAGAVCASPGLHSAVQEQKVKVIMARLLGKIIPKGTMASGLEQEALSKNPAIVTAYRNDPLVHDRVTFGWGLHGMLAIDYIFANADRINLPLLLMHGTADRLAFHSGSEELAKLVSGDCTLKLFEGLYHETHNEPEQDKVYAYLKKWLNSKI